jgi:uncharacterized protein (DUF433 family)
MPVVELTEEAYAIIFRRAQETAGAPGDVASELIEAESTRSAQPYVMQRSGVAGGKPVVKGTRIPIWQLAERLKLGDSLDDLLEDYPRLSAAVLYDAISYYYDHRAEIDHQIEENRLEHVLQKNGALMDERGRITFIQMNKHD